MVGGVKGEDLMVVMMLAALVARAGAYRWLMPAPHSPIYSSLCF